MRVVEATMNNCPKEPALFPPGWLENTVNNPKLAEAEIRYVNVRLREVQAENKEVRSERDDLERKLTHETKQVETLLLTQSLTKERESLQVRENKMMCKHLEAQLTGMKRLRDHLELQLRDAEISRGREAVRSQRLEYRGNQLKAALRKTQEDGKAMSAIRKLSRDSTVSKRMAAVFHPDKVPTAMCDVASELFTLVQNLREERGQDQ